jgi:hypothetical protein
LLAVLVYFATLPVKLRPHCTPLPLPAEAPFALLLERLQRLEVLDLLVPQAMLYQRQQGFPGAPALDLELLVLPACLLFDVAVAQCTLAAVLAAPC